MEDAVVVNAFCYALLVEQMIIVLGLPDYSGIGAAGHVFRDPDHVGGAVGAVWGSCRTR